MCNCNICAHSRHFCFVFKSKWFVIFVSSRHHIIVSFRIATYYFSSHFPNGMCSTAYAGFKCWNIFQTSWYAFKENKTIFLTKCATHEYIKKKEETSEQQREYETWIVIEVHDASGVLNSVKTKSSAHNTHSHSKKENDFKIECCWWKSTSTSEKNYMSINKMRLVERYNQIHFAKNQRRMWLVFAR